MTKPALSQLTRRQERRLVLAVNFALMLIFLVPTLWLTEQFSAFFEKALG
jgi:hypothetical protein